MKNAKMICFDMDGTIADLYGVKDWEIKLRAEDVSPYLEAKPMWDMKKLKAVCEKLTAQGWEIRIITWLSKDSTEEYKDAVRTAKWQWLAGHDFPLTHAHMIAYGTTKANSVRATADKAILIDDNTQVRNGWTLGETIDPQTQDIIKELERLAN